MEFIIIILAAIALVLWIDYLIAREFYFAAQEKGHDEKKYLWLCFLLGVVGYLLVIALPNNITPNNSQQITYTQKETKSEPTFTKAIDIGNGKWKCGNCQTENSINYGQCKKCGRFRGQ